MKPLRGVELMITTMQQRTSHHKGARRILLALFLVMAVQTSLLSCFYLYFSPSDVFNTAIQHMVKIKINFSGPSSIGTAISPRLLKTFTDDPGDTVKSAGTRSFPVRPHETSTITILQDPRNPSTTAADVDIDPTRNSDDSLIALESHMPAAPYGKLMSSLVHLFRSFISLGRTPRAPLQDPLTSQSSPLHSYSTSEQTSTLLKSVSSTLRDSSSDPPVPSHDAVRIPQSPSPASATSTVVVVKIFDSNATTVDPTPTARDIGPVMSSPDQPSNTDTLREDDKAPPNLSSSGALPPQSAVRAPNETSSLRAVSAHAPAVTVNPSSSISKAAPAARDVAVMQDPIEWLESPFVNVNVTEQLMRVMAANETANASTNGFANECHGVRTSRVQIEKGLPFPIEAGGNRTRLIAGALYELLLVSYGDDGRKRCVGGDYFETDLSGRGWKSRPPIRDHNDGTYSIRLHLDPRFSGAYVFRAFLLFSNYEGIRHKHPQNLCLVREVVSLELDFVVSDVLHESSPEKWMSRSESSPKSSILAPEQSSSASLSRSTADHDTRAVVRALELKRCERRDFTRKYWSGRWTRDKEYECPMDDEWRWNCMDPKLQCQKPWCEGPFAHLESDGWVYSAHCAFKLFQRDEAWKCLNNKWIFVWGDSNMGDSFRNLLNFVLGYNHSIYLERITDQHWSSPANPDQSFRLTSIFNGHHDASKNWLGLYSLYDPTYRELLRSFFQNATTPDVVIMNSGLHDGTHSDDAQQYLQEGVQHAVRFWEEILDGLEGRNPELIYRTTVTTAAGPRRSEDNPSKMEFYNHLMLDQLSRLQPDLAARLQIIDGFDITFPWHFNLKTTDGMHYGRGPSPEIWLDGKPGHRVFVDLMMVQIYLNAICPA